MKFTGIVRRIDDLGRVVIPKEIRRTLQIREGDPLELYVDNNVICFKKYEVNEAEHALACLEDVVNDMWDERELRGKIVPHIQEIKDVWKEKNNAR